MATEPTKPKRSAPNTADIHFALEALDQLAEDWENGQRTYREVWVLGAQVLQKTIDDWITKWAARTG